jgi:hypothetical protein
MITPGNWEHDPGRARSTGHSPGTVTHAVT